MATKGGEEGREGGIRCESEEADNPPLTSLPFKNAPVQHASTNREDGEMGEREKRRRGFIASSL